MTALGEVIAAPSGPARPPAVGRLMRGPVWFSAAIVALFFGALGTWAALAPLSSGAIAPGAVSPEGSLKTIQHLEGGIISVLHVREGQTVAVGEPLVTLESTRAAATYDARREQWLRLLAVRARLEAHATARDVMTLPEELDGIESSNLADFVANQQRLFAIRNGTQEQQEAIFARQIEQLESEIASVAAENGGLSTQLTLVNEELTAKESLMEQQLIARSTIQALQRQQASLVSAMAANEARIARAGQSIEETRLTVLQSRDGFQDQVAEELTQINNEIAQIDEDLRATGDVLRRTEIVSPVAGVVQNMRTQTTGGVIRAGDPIMDIVPVDDDMVVLVRLNPQDIDVVHPGLNARLTLLPFASRNALPLNGTVTQIAADITVEERTGHSYYEVKVVVSADELAKHEGMYLSSGMPADVTIVTGERTMLQYLMEPIMRSLQSAFVAD